jgi:hypothetical protein
MKLGEKIVVIVIEKIKENNLEHIDRHTPHNWQTHRQIYST